MAKKTVKTIADAMSCAAKIADGRACTQAEMKATIRLLSMGLKTARSTAKAARREATEAKDNFRALLGRVGL
jgi:outer membrane murein-binding lipoprotein Lpp